MAPLQLLDSYLAAHSYLGSDSGATLEDYKQCKGILPSTVKAETLPHLFRWHAHITALMQRHPSTDRFGNLLAQGTVPNLCAAAKPKQEAKPKHEAKPKQKGKAEQDIGPAPALSRK